MAQPFFSIIIPTKDRPNLVANTLYSLSIQTCKDFEVILSDNFTTDSCKNIFDLYADKINISYYKPKDFLIMADNFEFAYSKSTGKYITVLEDKFMFYPFALEYMLNTLEKKHVDYISYPYDYYILEHDYSLQIYYNAKLPYFINSFKQIKKHLNFDPFSIFCSSSIPNTGYILSGFFKKSLIEEVRSKFNGKIFFPPAPDLTSQIFISLSAKEAVYTGFPMVLVYKSVKHSTGRMQDSSSKFMKDSWAMLDSSNVINHIIYPDLTASISNFIAANYNFALSLLKSNVSINKNNLLFRIQDDLQKHIDKDHEQMKVAEAKIKRLFFIVRLINYFKIRYGFYINKYLLLDFIGINLWPINKLRKYRILKKHREILQSKLYEKKMSVQECLHVGDIHYRKVGFISENMKGDQ